MINKLDKKDFKQLEIKGDNAGTLGVEYFKDGSLNIYMETQEVNSFGDVEKVICVEEFEPVDIIALAKVLVELAGEQIVARNRVEN